MKRFAIDISIALALGLGLTLALLWVLGGSTHVARAGDLTVCPAGPPTCDYDTIQGAVDAANDGDLIKVAGGTYTENVTISRTLTIQGQGAANTRVDGNANGSVFTITSNTDVTLSNLTIANGSSTSGGGILILAGKWEGGNDRRTTVHIINSTITGNSATSGGGIGVFGNIDEFATVRVMNSTITGNSATSGGGIYSYGARWGFHSLLLTNSTLSVNTAIESGGGIYNSGNSSLGVTNSTLSGNSANKGGGIANRNGGLYITNSTLSGNSASDGGGIYNYGVWEPYANIMKFKATNSIVAYSPTGEDCTNVGADARLIDDGYNIVMDGSCISAATSRSGDPMLGLLQDNRGRTQTHALLPGSPAIDTGDNAACPATDQRGIPRPIDGDKNGTAVCDIGSYEFVQFAAFLYLPMVRK